MSENTPVTKADLAAALTQAVTQIREYVDERTGSLETHLREYIDERSRDLQTELLRAFLDYNNSANIRFRKLEADVSNIDTSATQRLGELERQMADLKVRLINLEFQR